MLCANAHNARERRCENFKGTLSEVSSQESHCPVSSCRYILMGGPGEITADVDAQVFAGVSRFQCLTMERVAGC